jgi:hypothetical protein
MIRWSDPLYEADRRVASVGAVMIGYIVPPDRVEPRWRWFLTFTRADATGYAVSEMYARRAVSRRWVEWIVAAGLTLAHSGGPRP